MLKLQCVGIEMRKDVFDIRCGNDVWKVKKVIQGNKKAKIIISDFKCVVM